MAVMPTQSARVRLGRAAEMLGISAETARRWVDAGQLEAIRSSSGQRLVALASVQRLFALASVQRLFGERRAAATDGRARRESTASSSARNRFAGIVTRIQRDG